jgi:hypothetical protein
MPIYLDDPPIVDTRPRPHPAVRSFLGSVCEGLTLAIVIYALWTLAAVLS